MTIRDQFGNEYIPPLSLPVCDNTILPPGLKVESSGILRGGEINPPNRATRRARKKAK